MPASRQATATILLSAVMLAMAACEDVAAPDPDVPGGFIAASAGSHHTCAATVDGLLLCWGRNMYTQLGDGTTSDRRVPAVVAGLANIVAVSAGDRHTCALGSGGGAYCWGSNAYGQLGTGQEYRQTRPAVVGTSVRFTAIAVGPTHSCGLDTEGRAHCWGSGELGEIGASPPDVCSGIPCSRLPREVKGGHRFTRIATGSRHTCAITLDGNLYCWGGNPYGELGSSTGETCDLSYGGTAYCATSPVPVTGGGTWTEVSAGRDHTCAIATDGRVFCWGRWGGGLLGDGGDDDGGAFRADPAPVAGDWTYTALSAGLSHTCAIAGHGPTFCWGSGALGAGSGLDSPVPVPVSTTLRFATVVVGVSHTCGVTRDGAMYCWGSNQYGQLGDGSYALGWELPVAVKGRP